MVSVGWGGETGANASESLLYSVLNCLSTPYLQYIILFSYPTHVHLYLRWGAAGTVTVAILAFLGLKCGRFLLDSAKAAEQPKRRDEK